MQLNSAMVFLYYLLRWRTLIEYNFMSTILCFNKFFCICNAKSGYILNGSSSINCENSMIFPIHNFSPFFFFQKIVYHHKKLFINFLFFLIWKLYSIITTKLIKSISNFIKLLINFFKIIPCFFSIIFSFFIF